MSQMYGKKRVVLSKSGKIVLAGGKSYHPIGKWELSKFGSAITAHVLQPEHRYSGGLTLGNCDLIVANSKDELRERIASLYA